MPAPSIPDAGALDPERRQAQGSEDEDEAEDKVRPNEDDRGADEDP